MLLYYRVTQAGCHAASSAQKEYSLNQLGNLSMVEPYVDEEFNTEKIITRQGLWNKACGRANKNVLQLLPVGLILPPSKPAIQVVLAM